MCFRILFKSKKTPTPALFKKYHHSTLVLSCILYACDVLFDSEVKVTFAPLVAVDEMAEEQLTEPSPLPAEKELAAIVEERGMEETLLFFL